MKWKSKRDLQDSDRKKCLKEMKGKKNQEGVQWATDGD